MISIPERIRQSPLFQRNGYVIVDGLLTRAHLTALRAESAAQVRHAQESRVPCYDGEEWRGGNPARKFLSAPGGPVQDEFYWGRSTLAFLERLVRCGVAQSGTRGTFNYYSRPGDYLGIHRDVDVCDLAVITCLADSGEAGGSGKQAAGSSGKMVFYPSRLDEPNGAIRRTPVRGAQLVRLVPGQSAILLGGLIPHAVLAMANGQTRVVSVLCYTLGGS